MLASNPLICTSDVITSDVKEREGANERKGKFLFSTPQSYACTYYISDSTMTSEPPSSSILCICAPLSLLLHWIIYPPSLLYLACQQVHPLFWPSPGLGFILMIFQMGIQVCFIGFCIGFWFSPELNIIKMTFLMRTYEWQWTATWDLLLWPWGTQRSFWLHAPNCFILYEMFFTKQAFYSKYSSVYLCL